jgi:enoyl-CoA hydratase
MTFTHDLPPGLRVEADGPVRTVVLDRPDALNAIDRDLHGALAQVWRRIGVDPDARVVVLTGAGRAFSAGGDLDWIASFADDHAARDESLREGAEIIEELIRFPLPIVTAINGPAVGLGFSIALLTDVVLIADDAYLADPHVPVGLVAGDGGAAFWPLLGPSLRMRELLYTGARIEPHLAVELGLATRVVAADELMTEARRVADRIARQPVAAVRGTKQVLNLHLARALGGAVPAGFAAELVSMQTDDHQERVRALRAKAE